MSHVNLASFPQIGVWAVLSLILSLGQGCSSLTTSEKPNWIDGESTKFPHQEFLIGRGEADLRSLATERAYGAVARVFRTHVTAHTTDHESYRLTEGSGSFREERQLTLNHRVQISTEKMLELVQVLESWFDVDRKLHHTLAGLNRMQAETALLERIEGLDLHIEEELSPSQQTDNQLATIRKMTGAIATLRQRKALNTDLRVIRTNGRGHPSLYRLGDLTGQLDSYMANNLIISVKMMGTPAMETRQSLIEGLLKEGLPVLQDLKSIQPPSDSVLEEGPVHLGVNGFVTTWTPTVGDPEFQFVKWCIDVVIVDYSNGQMVGAVSRRGREGQLTLQAAKQKAIRVMQHRVTEDIAHTVATYVYGEGEVRMDSPSPATCPRKNFLS